MALLANGTHPRLCEIHEVSPLHRLFHEYKYPELMFTVTFFILLMYLEEVLFAYRKVEQNVSYD